MNQNIMVLFVKKFYSKWRKILMPNIKHGLFLAKLTLLSVLHFSNTGGPQLIQSWLAQSSQWHGFGKVP